MDDLSALIARHGYSLLGMIAFLEAVGFPMPAALALLAAGAACAYGKLNPFVAIGVSVVALGIAAYVVYRIWIYRKYRLYRIVPRVPVQEVARRLTAKDASNILLVDVRSHGYYDADASRIKGSIRIEPNNLLEEIKRLPKDREIYLYCT